MSKDTITMRFRIKKSTPFAQAPPNAAKFYEALGRAVYLWGKFETHLQMTILSIWNMPEAKSLHARFGDEVPVSMKKRAKFWRTAFKSLPTLKPHEIAAGKVIAKAMEGARQRAVVVHGAWGEFKPRVPLSASITIYRHKRRILYIEEHQITLTKLRKMIEDFDELNLFLLPLSWNIFSRNAPVARKPSKPKPRRSGHRSAGRAPRRRRNTKIQPIPG